MTNHDLIGMLMVAAFIIPAILLVAYFLYDQRKQQREKKS